MHRDYCIIVVQTPGMKVVGIISLSAFVVLLNILHSHTYNKFVCMFFYMHNQGNRNI